MFCANCTGPLFPGKTFCERCGQYTASAMSVGRVDDDGFIDMCAVEASAIERLVTGGPWDTVWGGGFVPGTTTLLGGSPGLGKSTLLLQLSVVFAHLTGKPSYYVSAEQEKTELKLTLDRLELPLEPGQLRVLKQFGSGGDIAKEVFAKQPPGMIVLDSITALCGLKDRDRQLETAKLYKKYAVEYRALVFIVSQMQKEGDYAGLLALQHEVDTLVTLDGIADDRKRDRIFAAHPELEGDLREITAWKNRYGPTGQEFTLVMGKRGLAALPPKPEGEDEDEGPSATGDPLADIELERQHLREERDEALEDFRESMSALDERAADLAAQAKKRADLARRKKALLEACKEPPKKGKKPKKSTKKKAKSVGKAHAHA